MGQGCQMVISHLTTTEPCFTAQHSNVEPDPSLGPQLSECHIFTQSYSCCSATSSSPTSSNGMGSQTLGRESREGTHSSFLTVQNKDLKVLIRWQILNTKERFFPLNL